MIYIRHRKTLTVHIKGGSHSPFGQSVCGKLGEYDIDLMTTEKKALEGAKLCRSCFGLRGGAR